VGGRRPDFLIVGAMKGGTTTLYYHLSMHPQIHLPELKEPEVLVRDASDSDLLEVYAHHFRSARTDQICGEASTAYTKRPQHVGVAERARSLLGRDVKILYITRDPVARTLSQYRHERQHGTVSGDFAQAVRSFPQLTDYNRYGWQIAPWKDAFGAANVMELTLEDYTAHTQARLREVLEFLGVDPELIGPINSELKANSAEEQKHISNPALRAVVMSNAYQHYLKPLFPRHLRERVRRTLLPAPKVEKIEITPEIREFILERSQT
jgi:hypothetical protein